MLRILVIDDSKTVHAFIKSCLAKMDATLTPAFNGQEGVDACAKNPGAFDIILLDWEMPILNGPDTFERLKSMGSAVPVLMMTTKNSPEDISFMLEKGVNEYMLKPFTLDVLLEKIEAVLGRQVRRVA